MKKTLNFGLVIVGDEILSGKREDKHLPRVIELLAARGLAMAWARYVGDDRERLTSVLADTVTGGDVVLCCGGIGATPDDHTRQAAAAALGLPLELHPQARELILERMRDLAREQGAAYDPDRPDNQHRLNMGVFPAGASLIPNPYNKIPGFTVGRLHCMPGFPVMAHPMVEWLLDTLYADAHGSQALTERSLIVYGAMEAALTPLMEAVEAAHPELRVFSLPSVNHPLHGKHIELGVKGPAAAIEPGYTMLRDGLAALGVPLGPEMVR